LLEKICKQNCTEDFSGKFGEIRAKILRTPKNLPAPAPMMNRHLRLHCPLLKGERGKRSCHASVLQRPCAYYSTLSSLVVVGYNVCHWNEHYQRSPKIKQFIPTKISGNALKHGVEHTQFYVRATHIATAKIQACANVSSNSSRSEPMPLGWRTPRFDSLKLAKLHKNWEWA